MQAVKLTNRNIIFTEPMGNEYALNLGLIISKKHNYLIDTGIGSGSITPVMEYLKGNTNPIVVINTHFHWDHIWGNFLFKNNTIISHILCRKQIDEHWDEMLERNKGSIDGETEKCLPNLVFSDSITFCDDDIEIFYTPGHSIDCISVYDNVDRVLYAGDNIGDTDEVIVPYIETDIEVFRNTLEIYNRYNFEISVSGHNKPLTKEVLILMERDLEDCYKRQMELY
jgi:glyoxylase-like metal-dependent hydrolase (beta-lactamase superfamily II)